MSLLPPTDSQTRASTASTSIGHHHVEQVMGTAVSIDVRDPDVPIDAIDEVVDWLHHVDRTFSTHRPESPMSALGRGELSLDQAGPEIAEVLHHCEEVRRQSRGAFDIFEVPAPNGTTLDPSGLVKGWSIERAVELLERWGCTNLCINAGGDVAIRGRPNPQRPWQIGIRNPDDPETLATVVTGIDRLAIATSATYERGTHIIDPRSGRPASQLAGATVIGPDLGLADAYATTVFVLGLDGLAWVEAETPGYEAYVITTDQQTFWTAGFNEYRAATRSPRPEHHV